MVAFDNTILSVLLFPDAELQEGPDATPVERARERVNALVQEIADGGEQVLVPSPALAEVLATPDCDMEEVLSTLRVSAFIRIGDFDQRAAVELAIRLRNAAAAGDIREGSKTTKTKMKFDRQIVCQGRSKREPGGRSKRGPLPAFQAPEDSRWGRRLERSPARP